MGCLAVFVFSRGGMSSAQDNQSFLGSSPTEPSAVFEQRQEEIETDRDSFTPATTVVGRGRTVLESSYSFIDNRTSADSHSFPELLTRIGITDTIELRIGWNYEIGGGGSVSNTGSPDEDEPLGKGVPISSQTSGSACSSSPISGILSLKAAVAGLNIKSRHNFRLGIHFVVFDRVLNFEVLH
jgi:hypothetical protein